jgi:hypothetical protein
MVFEVDFSLKINGNFFEIHKALIFASSVSECQDKAEIMRNELPENKNHHIHIFIEE